MPGDSYFVQSLAKGLAVLEQMSKAGKPMQLSEIAKAMGINLTTATRLCHTLTQLGYLARDDQRRYILAPKVLALGYSVVSGQDWHEVSRVLLQELFDQVNETVNLALLDGAEILYLDRIRRSKYLPFDIRVGSTLPAYCTGMGKILLAYAPAELSEPVLESMELKPIAPATITDLDKFRRELETVRQNGFAINDEELAVGNRSIAVPIFGDDGYALASINIATPTTRHSLQEMKDRFLEPLRKTAEDITVAWRQLEVPVTRSQLLGGYYQDGAR